MPTSSAIRPRQARSIATRRRLLDAAVRSLVERGYASTTTAGVCELAGVSQGALFKHFPTKAALLAATVDHLFSELLVDLRRTFGTAASEDDSIAGALRLLDRAYREPRLLAALELNVVARTDPELAAALAPIVDAQRSALQREASALFPRAAKSNPDFAPFVDVVLAAIQGRALESLVARDAGADLNGLLTLYRLARREFGDRPPS